MFVFGLDLRAIRFSAFKSSNMFDKRYHLRSIRFIVYQLAMIIPVVSECLATDVIDKYLQLQNAVSGSQPGASYYNHDIVGVGSFSIFAGVYAAFVYGTMFFFLLFWPALPESVLWSRIKYGTSIFASLCVFGAAISSTIVVAAHHAHLIPSPTGSFQDLAAQFANPTPPYYYRDYSICIAWVVLMWIGWICTVVAEYYVFKAARFHLDNPHVVGTYLARPSSDFVEEKSDV